jgi:hypothetical protein
VTYLTHWGVVNSRVTGNGNAALGGTSNVGISGVGALNLRTADATDRAAFGNEVDFNGRLLSSLTTLFFAVDTTTQNNSTPANMPGLSLEINPDVLGSSGPVSMQYVPDNPAFPGASGSTPPPTISRAGD